MDGGRLAAGTLGLLVALVAPTAGAAVLRIAVAEAPVTADPYVARSTADRALARHLFDRLVEVDAGGRLVPGVASSWHSDGARRWVFGLRANVRFHDGALLSAADVVASLGHAAARPRAVGGALQGATFVALDRSTVAVDTATPDATLPAALTTVAIAGGDAAGLRTDDRGAPIGSGPYRLTEFRPGAALRLERYEAYRGNKPEWTEVVVEALARAEDRVAALRAGDVDLVAGWEALGSAEPGLAVWRSAGDRLLYLQLDQARGHSPFVTASDGTAIDNPLTDLRVRRAIALAIDRELLARAVPDGAAFAAGQLVPPAIFGHDASLSASPSAAGRARALLAEAGLAGGFRLTLHCPAGRYPGDARVCAVVAQMLSDVGVATTPVTLSPQAFFRRATRGGEGGTPEFSAMLLGWLAGASGAASPLRALVHSFAPGQGFGRANRGRFTDPDIDALIEEALATFGRGHRAGLLALATERALDAVAVVPLYFQRAGWATRAGIGYRARRDTLTLAMDAYSE